MYKCLFNPKEYFDGLVQDCSNSGVLAMQLMQSCFISMRFILKCNKTTEGGCPLPRVKSEWNENQGGN